MEEGGGRGEEVGRREEARGASVHVIGGLPHVSLSTFYFTRCAEPNKQCSQDKSTHDGRKINCLQRILSLEQNLFCFRT